MTPFITAWIVLFSWPVVAVLAFRLSKSLPLATLITLVGGYLLLPERVGIDLPVLPELNKNSIPVLSAFVLLLLAARNPAHAGTLQPGWLPRDKLALGLIGLLMFSAFATALTNMDTVMNGGIRQPGMRLYDGFSIALSITVFIFPFLIARKVLATPEGLRTLAIFLVAAASAYAFLALWEVRMSPRLNVQFYGFFAHGWHQHIRSGGFRPLVFLEHGLSLGIFFTVAIILALGMTRYESGPLRVKMALAALWLLLTISLSKVLGAFAITLLFIPLVLFFGLRLQLLACFGLACIIMLYPALRHIDRIPTDKIVALAADISPERAQSVEFRFKNEDLLLDRAKQRPLFGWGGWGRNRIFDERGEDISVTDGRWIILFGQGGWTRYIGEFGLLLLALFRLPFTAREKLSPTVAILAMALTANMIDLLPNAGVSVVTWLIAGALVGYIEQRKPYDMPVKEPVPVKDGRRTTPVYARYRRELTPSGGPQKADADRPFRRHYRDR